MLESLIITLREGIEAALVVGIIYAFLRKEGLSRQLKAVWAGLGAAVAASVAGAWVLHSVALNEEAFEGVLYVASAVVVSTMVVWMWRHARHVSGEIKGALGRITAGGGPAVFGGVFLFTFLMVFREGVETALFLAAVSLTTSGLLTGLGAVLGIGLAVWFGVLFIRGSVRMDLGRFFTVTGIALFIFTVQLLLNGYHELSEAGWLPASPATMATVGPLVRYELFFIVAVLALPLIALAVPGRSARPADAVAANPAERRLRRVEVRRQERTRMVAGTLGVVILALLGLGFTYARSGDPTPVQVVEPGPDGSVRIALASLGRGELHRYGVDVDGATVRFIAMRVGETGNPDDVVAGLDACVICGDQGYSQEGSEVFCRHCHSVIHPPTIGRGGGCNPIPLEIRVEGGELIVDASELGDARSVFSESHPGRHHGA
jgi:FTR1 family protein